MLGNLMHGLVLAFTNSFEAVTANTSEELTVTVSGLKVGDFVKVDKATFQAGLGIVGARVSADNTLAVEFMNNTASSITPTASDTYRVLVCRPELPVRSNAMN